MKSDKGKMRKLNINLFINAVDDFELSQYYVLGILKNHSRNLHSNKLYPALKDLIEIGEVLEKIVNEKKHLENIFPQKNVDATLSRVEVGQEKKDINFVNDVNKVFDFINWAYPKIEEAISEGKAIYSYVKQNIKIEEVGILPLYKNNGYIIITDNKQSMVNVFRYDIPFISTDMNSSSSVTINHLQSYSKSESTCNPASIKMELIERYEDLPNPATYRFETDLDFPFSETILPIAKRRLLKKLVS